jgi:dUTP pyrophosphatase
MKIPAKIKLFDDSLPLPQYHTAGSAGFDLYSRLDLTLPPKEVTYAPVNIALELPREYWLLIAPRSSLHKHGLTFINSVGIIDSDYCGDDNEIGLLLYNFTDKSVKINHGDRLGQGIIIPRYVADFTQVKKLTLPNRGGHGSTGKNVFTEMHGSSK